MALPLLVGSPHSPAAASLSSLSLLSQLSQSLRQQQQRAGTRSASVRTPALELVGSRSKTALPPLLVLGGRSRSCRARFLVARLLHRWWRGGSWWGRGSLGVSASGGPSVCSYGPMPRPHWTETGSICHLTSTTWHLAEMEIFCTRFFSCVFFMGLHVSLGTRHDKRSCVLL